MALREWKFEKAAGTTVTRLEMVAEDGVSVPTHFGINSGTPVMTYSNEHSHMGTSFKGANTGAASYILRFPYVAATHKQGAFRFYHYCTAPPSTVQILRARHATGALFDVVLGTTGSITLRSPSGAALGAGSTPLVFDQLNRIECVYTVGSSITTGSATLNVYAGDALTPYSTLTVTGVDLGITDVVSLEMGTPSTVSGTWVQYIDSVALDSEATNEIGPASSGVPLATPTFTITTTEPSGPGMSDGTITATITAAVPSASGYAFGKLPGSVTTGIDPAETVQSGLAKTWTGQVAGTQTITVMAV